MVVRVWRMWGVVLSVVVGRLFNRHSSRAWTVRPIQTELKGEKRNGNP
jgi:hypothetical protein